MAEPKIKPAKREAGKSKFRLPERTPRPVEENPLRELLREAKAQEEAGLEPKARTPQDTPVKKIAGVRVVQKKEVINTPAPEIAGVSLTATSEVAGDATPITFAEFSRRCAGLRFYVRGRWASAARSLR
jgi:hypothetical protein